MRTNGASAGTCDVYYFNSEGKRFRSRAEIAREYGIAAPTKRQKRAPAPKPPPKHEPLTREQAKEAAVKFAEEHTAPLRLLRDVKVVQFGTPSPAHSTEDKLVMVNYRARWTDGPSKVVFESRIEEDEGRPSYKVYVIDTTDEGKKLRYPVGKGSSPDDIWTKVEERQKDVLSGRVGGQQEGNPSSPTKPASPSKEGKLSTVDIILKKVSSLSGVWGLEKYGFIDLTCLKAMEGQEGVSETVYKYVNERNGWVQEQMNLRTLLAERGQKLRGGFAARPGKEGQIERVVERVMDNMLRKVLTWNEKYEAKLEKQKERELFKLERQREREQKLREKRLAREEVNAGLPDDLSLEGAEAVPPEPAPVSSLIGGGDCAQWDVERVVEMWCLAHRFRDMLDISTKNMPTIEGMLKTYCQGEGACRILIGMVDFLLSELCNDIVQQVTHGDAQLRRVDFIPPTKNARMLAATHDSWPSVLHRYLYSVAIAAARWAELTGKKEDLNFINYPLDHVHPYDVMDKITSGPTMLELAAGEMSLMLTDPSEQRIQSRRDALSFRSAALINGTTLEDSTVARNDKMLRAVLAKLQQVPEDLSPSGQLSIVDISFMGPEAALETRLGYPMDMTHVVSRVESLVYQMEEDCFRSFASDVFFACKMLDVACQRDTGNKFGTAKQVSKRQEMARWVTRTLKELSDLHEASGVAGVLEALGSQTIDGQPIEGAATPRNAPPLAGACFVCWQKESQEDREQGNVLEACSSCSMVAHSNCLVREWNLVSMDKEDNDAKCLMCCSLSKSDMTRITGNVSGAAAAELRIKQRVFPPGGYATLWHLVRSLYAVEFSDWEKEQKFELVRMVTLLVSESPAVRDLLEDDSERQRAAKAKLASCRTEIKQLQQEIKKATAAATDTEKGDKKAEAEKNGGEAAPVPATGQQSRVIREAESKRDKLIITVSKLEDELKHSPPTRKQLLGYDRHWNKYWSMPPGSLDRQEPLIIVEHDCASANGMKPPPIAFYRGIEAVDSLLKYVNPKGARESVLRDRLIKLRDIFNSIAGPDAGGNVGDDEGRDEGGVQAMECAATNGNVNMDEDRAPTSSLERFRDALLEYGNGLPVAVFHEVRGKKANRDAWATRTAAVGSSYQALALMVELERMLDPSSFKVHWRNWGIPAPDASIASMSMATCFMRLENLKKAVKLSSNQTFSLSMLNVKDQETNAGAQDEDQDSEIARNLDAELNRRRETKSRRNWEVTSPRNRRGIGVTSYKEASDGDDDEKPSTSASASDDDMTE